MKKFLAEFKAFALKGNVIDLAVGVMIGGAFGNITSSLVNDIFMPLIGMLTGGLDFSSLFIALDGNHYDSLQAAADANAATLNYGKFITTVVDFALIALCVFLFVKLVNKLMPKKEQAPKKAARLCPFCKSEIADDATRCPHCTSQL